MAKKENYEYKISYNDYEEQNIEENIDEYIDDYIKPITVNESSIIITNLSVLVFWFFILINPLASPGEEVSVFTSLYLNSVPLHLAKTKG